MSLPSYSRKHRPYAWLFVRGESDKWSAGLIRFIARNEPSKILIGEPVSGNADIGLALRNGQDVWAYLFSGSSVLAPGSKTEQRVQVDRVFSPLAQHEVGTIRCIGLNVRHLIISTISWLHIKLA